MKILKSHKFEIIIILKHAKKNSTNRTHLKHHGTHHNRDPTSLPAPPAAHHPPLAARRLLPAAHRLPPTARHLPDVFHRMSCTSS